MNGNDPGGIQNMTADQLRAMREEELLDVIRQTVQELHVMSDRLESYVSDRGYASASGDGGAH